MRPASFSRSAGICLTIAGLAAVAAAHAANPFYEKSYAVVIGIDDYREDNGWPRLACAVKDAQAAGYRRKMALLPEIQVDYAVAVSW